MGQLPLSAQVPELTAQSVLCASPCHIFCYREKAAFTPHRALSVELCLFEAIGMERSICTKYERIRKCSPRGSPSLQGQGTLVSASQRGTGERYGITTYQYT